MLFTVHVRSLGSVCFGPGTRRGAGTTFVDVPKAVQCLMSRGMCKPLASSRADAGTLGNVDRVSCQFER